MALSSLIETRLTPTQQEALEAPPASLRRIRSVHDELARRYAPIFVQSVERYVSPGPHRPWRDFIVPMDFNASWTGSSWKPDRLGADEFQKEESLARKVAALRALESPDYTREEPSGPDGPLELRSARQGAERLQIDLRPVVYYAVLTHSRFAVCHYVVYHTDSAFLEDSEVSGDGGYHPGDLEGATVIVDAASERVLALLAVFHNEVRQETYADPWQWRYFSSFLRERLAFEDFSPEDENGESWSVREMAGDTVLSDRPLRHCYVLIESGTHAQRRYRGRPEGGSIVYYLDREDGHRRPPLTPGGYSHDTQAFPFVPYKLVYIGSRPVLDADRWTMWGAYHTVGRIGRGMNPPWQWAASNHPELDRPWWPNPLPFAFHKAVRPDQYTFNPYVSLVRSRRRAPRSARKRRTARKRRPAA